MDPTGLWATVGLGYQAQFGDTLWDLSELLFGSGIYWEDLGYPYDIKKRPLQVGDIISYDGGLVTIENGVVGITASYLLYNPDGTRHIPQTMPDPPRQDPPKNPSSGAPSNPTPTKPNPDSVSSTAGPGNSGSSSGREHIGGSNSGGTNTGEKTPSIYDLTEFEKSSDTYKIIKDLSKRAKEAKNTAERNRLSIIAEDARRLARVGTPYMYGQNKVMAMLHENAAIATTYLEHYLNYLKTGGNALLYFYYAIIKGLPMETLEPYIWFVNMTCTEWNYKLNSNWQVGYHSKNYANFEGNNMDIDNNWNWLPWIYFEGDIWGADQIGNINLAYVGYKMGYGKSFLIDNFVTRDDERDSKALDMGFALAEEGR